MQTAANSHNSSILPLERHVMQGTVFNMAIGTLEIFATSSIETEGNCRLEVAQKLAEISQAVASV